MLKKNQVKEMKDFNKQRSSPSEVFLGKTVLKICSKCTGEHPCLSSIQ